MNHSSSKHSAGKRVVMMVNNSGSTDNRVVRSAQALRGNGYECNVIAIQHKGDKKTELISGITYHRVKLYKGPHLNILAFFSAILPSVILKRFEIFYFRNFIGMRVTSGKKFLKRQKKRRFNNTMVSVFIKKIRKLSGIVFNFLIQPVRQVVIKMHNYLTGLNKAAGLPVKDNSSAALLLDTLKSLLYFLYSLLIIFPYRLIVFLFRTVIEVAKLIIRILSQFISWMYAIIIKTTQIISGNLNKIFKTSKFLHRVNANKIQLQFSISLYPLSRDLKGDIYHSHDLWTLHAGIAAARQNHAKLIYDSHEIETHRNTPLWSKIQKEEWSKYEKRLIGAASEVITVSDGCASYISDLYNIRRIHVIRNLPTKNHDLSKISIRKALKIDKDIPLIIYVGSVTFGRGLEYILETLEQLPEYVFCTIGPVNKKFRIIYNSEIERLSLNSRVYELEPVLPSVLISFIRDADISLSLIQNVCLSYYNSLPNKLFESMMARVPVICSDFPDMSEVVRQYRAGETCKPDDPVAIAGTIRNVYKNRNKYYPESIVGSIDKELNFECESRKLLEVYKEIS